MSFIPNPLQFTMSGSEGSNGSAEEEFDSLLNSARPSYVIPPQAFEGYRIKKGLREADGTGVMVGVTRIGNAHGYVVSEGERIPVEGTLEYRGYDLSDMIDSFVSEGRFGFEECVFLLFFGHLPTATELAQFDHLLTVRRRLPPRFTEDIIMKAPSRSIMNKLQSAVLSLYAYDDNPDEVSMENMLRQSIKLVACMPVIAAQSYAVYRNVFCGKSLNLHNPRDDLSTAENFLRVLRPDKRYTEAEARLLDLCLVIHAEHGGGNCSTFATRVLSSSGTDTYSAVSAGIGALKGFRHGGANIKVQEMFDCIKSHVRDIHDDEEISAFLLKILRREANDGSGLIYGMGHAVYTKSDPRAVILKRYARSLAYEKGYGDDFDLLESIERLTPGVFCAYKGLSQEMCANVDLYSGLVYRMLEIPVEMYTPLFTVARTAGWCAHRIEEYLTAGRIIRPGYKCICKPCAFTGIAERPERPAPERPASEGSDRTGAPARRKQET